MKKYALVFSGQGSERVGMFNDLLKEPVMLNQVLDTLKEQLNLDFHDAVITKDAGIVNKNNQLLLSLYHHLLTKLLTKKIGYSPAYCMGHSFGQFSALTNSGAVDFVDMVDFINKRTDIINSGSIEVKAVFKSIHGMTLETFEHFQANEGLAGQVELALHNQKEQVVCGTTKAGEAKLNELSAKYNYVLKHVHVSRPYHTQFMKEYNQLLLPHIDNLVVMAPQYPVVLNNSIKAASDAELLRDETKIQMIKPVFWYDSVKSLSDKVDAFVIIDPSETQYKILRRITDKKIHNINNLGTVKMIEKKGV
ncbi:MAG: acyltransferase domain-containing protein [Firmicutes bacterium]|nr:acyltransferase domain-containing protein [Bacillota bacterium]